MNFILFIKHTIPCERMIYMYSVHMNQQTNETRKKLLIPSKTYRKNNRFPVKKHSLSNLFIVVGWEIETETKNQTSLIQFKPFNHGKITIAF